MTCRAARSWRRRTAPCAVNDCLLRICNVFASRRNPIMEMKNIIKNQERVIEELMLKVLDIKIENEVGEVSEVPQV